MKVVDGDRVTLTPAQEIALRVLGDGAVHEMWKRRTDTDGTGHGRVNMIAAGALTRLRLARSVDPGTVFVAGKCEITNAGRAWLDAHV